MLFRSNVAAAGKWRGGIGSVRKFTYLADGGFSIEGEGHKYRPWGFDGGAPGTTGELKLLHADGRVTELVSKVPYHRMAKGDCLAAYGPCGGGYGNPKERDPELVLADVLDELISAEQAAEQYGVVIRNGQIDREATAARRA